MFVRDDARLPWVKGTPFGREVVPEVWRKRATSDGCGGSESSAARGEILGFAATFFAADGKGLRFAPGAGKIDATKPAGGPKDQDNPQVATGIPRSLAAAAAA